MISKYLRREEKEGGGEEEQTSRLQYCSRPSMQDTDLAALFLPKAFVARLKLLSALVELRHKGALSTKQFE